MQSGIVMPPYMVAPVTRRNLRAVILGMVIKFVIISCVVVVCAMRYVSVRFTMPSMSMSVIFFTGDVRPGSMNQLVIQIIVHVGAKQCSDDTNKQWNRKFLQQRNVLVTAMRMVF